MRNSRGSSGSAAARDGMCEKPERSAVSHGMPIPGRARKAHTAQHHRHHAESRFMVAQQRIRLTEGICCARQKETAAPGREGLCRGSDRMPMDVCVCVCAGMYTGAGYEETETR